MALVGKQASQFGTSNQASPNESADMQSTMRFSQFANQTNRMQQQNDDSTVNDHNEQNNSVMVKSMERALAIPDVYIRKRGLSNRIKPQLINVAPEKKIKGLTGRRMMNSVVMSHKPQDLLKIQSSLSEVTSGASSSVRSKPHREHVIRNQTLQLNALSDKDLYDQATSGGGLTVAGRQDNNGLVGPKVRDKSAQGQ